MSSPPDAAPGDLRGDGLSPHGYARASVPRAAFSHSTSVGKRFVPSPPRAPSLWGAAPSASRACSRFLLQRLDALLHPRTLLDQRCLGSDARDQPLEQGGSSSSKAGGV